MSSYGLCILLMVAVIFWKSLNFSPLHMCMFSNFIIGCLYFDTEASGLLLLTKTVYLIVSSFLIVTQIFDQYIVLFGTVSAVASFHLIREQSWQTIAQGSVLVIIFGGLARVAYLNIKYRTELFLL